MTYTKGFNPKNLDLLRKQLEVALAEIDPSLTMSIGKMTYSDGEVGMKLTANVNGLKSQADIDLERYCELYGFDHTVSKVLPRFGSCKLVEFKSRNRTYPWIVLAADGKRYKLGHEKIEKYWKTESNS